MLVQLVEQFDDGSDTGCHYTSTVIFTTSKLRLLNICLSECNSMCLALVHPAENSGMKDFHLSEADTLASGPAIHVHWKDGGHFVCFEPWKRLDDYSL